MIGRHECLLIDEEVLLPTRNLRFYNLVLTGEHLRCYFYSLGLEAPTFDQDLLVGLRSVFVSHGMSREAANRLRLAATQWHGWNYVALLIDDEVRSWFRTISEIKSALEER